MNQVNAVPGRMVDFLQISIPDLAPLKRSTPAASCAPGVVMCNSVFTADPKATTKLHEFLTHMTQGITAYRELVTKCAQTYADGSAYTEATLRAACTYDARQMLPDVAPGLTTPNADTR